MITDKIQPYHLEKQAYVYLRQSSIGQVRFNQESTQRQYALQDKAQQMGWSPSTIKILDGDLGISGTQSTNREDFKTLVADVSMGKVGAVFALEASRLSRSCTDWHRLLELCAMTDTLLIDEDGCYNLSDFNDQLLLNFKGSMSFAELHFMHARLHGGRTNKAQKGELRFPLPVGFCHDEKNQIRFDTDEQVRHTLKLFFKVFREQGSAYGIVQYFGQNKILFPKRAYGGIWKGKLIWGRLSYSRACEVLKNPGYAGAYVYGRHTFRRKMSETGQLQQSSITLPMDKWPIVIKDHHEGYISWEEYLENQKTLKQNQAIRKKENMCPASAREGLALLQGLLLCGFCGHRLSPRYRHEKKIYPYYCCNWKKSEGVDRNTCLTVNATALDEAISQKVLVAIAPAQIAIAIKAFEELECRSKSLERHWDMKIKRAEYEAQLAQRRYEEVDPSNRLVAATLEKEWNGALVQLKEIQAQYGDYQKKNSLTSTKKQKESILALAKDFPRLWNAPSTSPKDRKRILRLLIKDITVKKFARENKATLYIRWQGGAREELEVLLPLPIYEKYKYPDEIVRKVRELACTLTDSQIAEKFNQEGLPTSKGKSFVRETIKWIRYIHKIPPAILQKPEELSINQVAKKFGVSNYVVRYWIEKKMVNARHIGSRVWVTLDPTKEAELKKQIETSTKIAVARLKSQNIVGRDVL